MGNGSPRGDAPAVTVVVPTFRSGPGLQRVFDSIDAVTLAPGQLEVIFADDGSGDDTVERLREFARERPHVQVLELENSGWPSHPRNVGIEQAHGEYLLFMDHDDSLYPDALRRAYDFAVEHDADVVSPKESKTNDVWWGVRTADVANAPDIRRAGGVERLIPLVPHKLYRRQLLLDHDIRFPEGSRFLWEDWYVNLPSYRHGKVAALADTIVYRWHHSGSNTSDTFDPSREDYWDKLDDLFEHIGVALEGAELAQDRITMITHNLRVRVIQRTARQLTAGIRGDGNIGQCDATAEARSVSRAARLLRRYARPRTMREMAPVHRALARLILTGRVNWVRTLQLALESITAKVRITDLVWCEGILHLELETTWRTTDPDRATIVADGSRGRLDLGRTLNLLVPRDLRAVGTSDAQSTELVIRDRVNHISWPVRTETIGEPVVETDRMAYRTRVAIDPSNAAAGRPMPSEVWDVRVRSLWMGLDRRGGVAFAGSPAPVLSGRRQGVAYRNTKGMLSVDLSGRLRTPFVDAGPQPGPIGSVRDFRVRLPGLALHRPEPTPVGLAAIPADATFGGLPRDERRARLAELAEAGGLSARVLVDDEGAWLIGSASLPPGDYALWSDRGENWAATRYALTVADDGMAQLRDTKG